MRAPVALTVRRSAVARGLAARAAGAAQGQARGLGARDRARRGARLRGAADQRSRAERVLAGGALARGRGRPAKSAARARASTRCSIRASRACRRSRSQARCSRPTRSCRAGGNALHLLGVDAFRAALVQPALIGDARADTLELLRPDALFLSPAAADWLKSKPGDRFAHPGRPGEVRSARGRAAARSGARAPRRDGHRRRAAGAATASARISRIDIRAAPRCGHRAICRRACRRSCRRACWSSGPQSELQRNANLSRAYRVNLNVLALVALFTGGFLVFSTQALSVVRRRAQLALLRVLGVTRGGDCAHAARSRAR